MRDGIPIPEAAAALGISERTVRRRIKDGDLNAYEIHTVHGPSWRVVLPAGNGRQGGGTTPPDQTSTDLTTVDSGLDRDRVIGALLMEMAQRIEALEASRPEYGPHEPGPPVVLRREEYPSEDTPAPDPAIIAPGGFWARLRAWWEGGR